MPNNTHAVPNAADRLKLRQGNILVIGILTAATGVTFTCNIMAASGVSWAMIGLILCAIGGLQAYAARQFSSHLPSLPWILAIVFFIAFGLLALAHPSGRLSGMSLVFFGGLIAVGGLRIHCGHVLQSSGRGWRWLAVAGSTTMAIGSFLMARWPTNDMAFAGQLLALDLAAYGVGLVGFALQLGTTASPHRMR